MEVVAHICRTTADQAHFFVCASQLCLVGVNNPILKYFNFEHFKLKCNEKISMTKNSNLVI